MSIATIYHNTLAQSPLQRGPRSFGVYPLAGRPFGKRRIIKEMPHNARGTLTAEFQPSAACKALDYATR